MPSELPISSPYRSTPDLAVSDGERDQLSRRLNTAYADGGLSAEDYQARLDTLFAANTLGQLVPVVEGLPPAQTYVSPAMVSGNGGEPGELTEARSATRVWVVLVAAVVALVLLIAILGGVLLALS